MASALRKVGSDPARPTWATTLNNLAIAPMKDGGLTLEAVTKTFRYLDEEEVAKQRKQAKEAKKK